MIQCINQNKLSETEETQISEILSQPVVKRYLLILQAGIVHNLCTGAPADNEQDSIYMRNESVLKGQLALLETLLSIQSIKPKEQ